MTTSFSIDASATNEAADIEAQKNKGLPVVIETGTNGPADVGAQQKSSEDGCCPEYLSLSHYWRATATFRRFSDLNMLNLLCLQAELTQLQSEFYTLALKHPHPQAENGVDNFSRLVRCVERQQKPHSPEHELFHRIRIKLNEYSKLITE
jgi:hypothetical protein